MDINHTKRSFFDKIQPLIIWGISDVYFILAVTVSILFGVLSPNLQKELNITSPQLGFLGFGFFISFGVAQLLTGSLIDSRGPRLTLSLSASIAAIGLFLLSTAQGFYSAFLAQVITGAGFSISYAGAIYLASTWFSQSHFSLLSGITQMSSNLISATLILIMALTGLVMMDFRVITSLMAFIVLVVACLLFLLVRNSPSQQQRSNSIQKPMFWKDLSTLLHIPQYWLGAMYFSATISVYLTFSSLWNIPESMAYGRDLQTATMMSATLRYGSALGAFVAGLLGGYLGKCSILAKFYSSGALVVGALLIYGPAWPTAVVFLLFALLGFFFGGSIMGFPLVGQYITLKGTGFGLMVAMGYLICALQQYLIGTLLGHQLTIGSLPTVHAFKLALTPLVISLAVGWVCSLWLRDPNNKQV